MSSVHTEADLKVFARAKGAKNAYKVPVKQWRKWSELARRVFNLHFYELKENQSILSHPQCDQVSVRMWRTLAWNAAWLAADSVMSALHVMSKEWKSADFMQKHKESPR